MKLSMRTRNFFSKMHDVSDLTISVLKMDEESGTALVSWENQASGYSKCSDTLIFNKASKKIVRQNMMVNHPQNAHTPAPTPYSAGYKPTTVKQVWGNHLASFGWQDVDRALLDYSDNSVLIVHNEADQATKSYMGLKEIRTGFANLFASMKEKSTHFAVSMTVPSEGPVPMVFNSWQNLASGYKDCTESVLLDDQLKISRHHMAVHYTPHPPVEGHIKTITTAKHVFEQYMSALYARDIAAVMSCYSKESVLVYYDGADSSSVSSHTHSGLPAIQTFMTDLFAQMAENADFDAPFVDIEEWPVKNAFAIWTSLSSGFTGCSETVTYNDDLKIANQNLFCNKQ